MISTVGNSLNLSRAFPPCLLRREQRTSSTREHPDGCRRRSCIARRQAEIEIRFMEADLGKQVGREGQEKIWDSLLVESSQGEGISQNANVMDPYFGK